jgi:hypothetical protein
MGKWDYLRSKYPKVPVDADYQQKVDAILDTVAEGYNLKLRDLPDADLKNVYVEKRAELDGLNAQVKTLTLEIEAITRLMVEHMEEEGQSNITFEDGISIGHSVEPYPFVEDQSKLLQWVKDNKMEAMLTLNYQTMSSLVKERLEGKVNEPLPDGVNVFMKDKLSCRGRKNSKTNTAEEA